MKIIEKKHCFLITDVFPGDVICGFTKKHVSGLDVPADFALLRDDIPQAESFAYLDQIHSSHVLSVDSPGKYTGDGIFCGNRSMMLMVRTADCLPLYACDFHSGLIGMVHMGWRPALKGILHHLDIDMENSSVIAGVGLRSCCYEMGAEFRHYPAINPFLESRGTRLYFKPIEFARVTLTALGLIPGHFYDLRICSYCGDGFHSFRRDKTERRTISFILKQ